MATVSKRLCAGTFTDSSAPLYTAPATAGSHVVIKAMTLCNITAAAATVTITFNGIDVINAYSIPAHDTITIPFIDQIIEATEVIAGLAGTDSAITYYISGKEVS